MQIRAPLSSRRPRDKLLGLLIIAGTFVGSLGLAFWAKSETAPEAPKAPEPPSKADLAGFPNSVRPFQLIPRAAALTPRTLFRGFEADGVRPDGTIDMTRSGSRVAYSFQSPMGSGPQPPREGGSLPRRSSCGKQRVQLTNAGIALEMDVTAMPCQGSGPKELPIPKACTLQDVWSLARARKIQADVARIEYYSAKAGPAYRFIAGKETFVVSAVDCKKVLSGKAQRGHVP